MHGRPFSYFVRRVLCTLNVPESGPTVSKTLSCNNDCRASARNPSHDEEVGAKAACGDVEEPEPNIEAADWTWQNKYRARIRIRECMIRHGLIENPVRDVHTQEPIPWWQRRITAEARASDPAEAPGSWAHPNCTASKADSDIKESVLFMVLSCSELNRHFRFDDH